MPHLNPNINISIIGPGKVGTTLALALKRRGYPVVSVIGRSRAAAGRCAELVSCTRYGNRCADIDPRTNLLVIATPDSIVNAVAHDVDRWAPLRFNHLTAFHVSGVLTTDALLPLARRGACCFSLHPMQTFAGSQTPDERVTSLRGISYGFEGNARAERFARRLVKDLRGSLVVIPKERKILYHIACVFASNYLLTTIRSTEAIGKRLRWKTLSPFEPLISQTIANATRSGSSRVLTGPIARGDVETVKAHLVELRRQYPELLPLYRELGLRTVEIAEKQERTQPQGLRDIRRILKQRS